MGWSYDEFGGKIQSMMREGSTMASFRGMFRKLDDCPDFYEHDTVGRGTTHVDRPYLALLASMTPADMEPFARRGGALWRDGFFARFAFVAPGPDAQPSYGRFPEGVQTLPADLVRTLRQWHDRLGVPAVHEWRDLSRAELYGEVALADPTRSSSVAGALEMVVQEQMQLRYEALAATEPNEAAREARPASKSRPTW